MKTVFKRCLQITVFVWSFALWAEGKPFAEKTALLVIGGGISGLSCANSCLSHGIPTMVCDDPPPKIFDQTVPITSEPLLAPTSWQKGVQKMREQFVKNGGKVVASFVDGISKAGDQFSVETKNGIFYATAVVVATGSSPPQYEFFTPSIQKSRVLLRLWEQAMFSSNDTVVFIGDDDQVVAEAIMTSLRAKKVVLFSPRSSASPLTRVLQRLNNITWIPDSTIRRLVTTGEKVRVEYARNGARLVVEGSWVVLANKWTPQSFLVDDIAAVDSQGALITNEETKMTSVQGLFACGEVTKKTSFTFARSIADGLETSTAVIAYLLENGWMPEKKPTPPEGAVQPKPPAPPENPPGEKKVVPLA